MTIKGRVAIAVAAIAIGVAIALLGAPSTCMSPAIGCPPEAPDCAPMYCSHEYVPARMAVGLVSVIAGGLIVSLGRKNQRSAG